jgi:hypothetical protein
MLGVGAVSTMSLSPSILKCRFCSVPFHDSFRDASTVKTKLLPSMRYLPLTATIDLCSAALSASPHSPLAVICSEECHDATLSRDDHVTLGVFSKSVLWGLVLDDRL